MRQKLDIAHLRTLNTVARLCSYLRAIFLNCPVWGERDVLEPRSARDEMQITYTPAHRKIGSIMNTCRCFGISRAGLYRWRVAYKKHGETELVYKPSFPILTDKNSLYS